MRKLLHDEQSGPDPESERKEIRSMLRLMRENYERGLYECEEYQYWQKIRALKEKLELLNCDTLGCEVFPYRAEKVAGAGIGQHCLWVMNLLHLFVYSYFSNFFYWQPVIHISIIAFINPKWFYFFHSTYFNQHQISFASPSFILFFSQLEFFLMIID
jgi:hypothetical protein